jgi:isopentenyl-diphosphate delta-isomerase
LYRFGVRAALYRGGPRLSYQMFSNLKKTVAIVFVLIGLAVSAFFMVNVELPQWSHWLSGLNVVLFAIPAFWATRRWLGWRDAFILWALLGIYALLVETSAIFTGFPYGHFGYSDLLGAKIVGLTPWTVFLAWTPLILGAYAIARAVTRSVVLRLLLTTLLTTDIDLVLDPGAVRLGFWKYAGSGGFYGVPTSNFAGWLVTCAIAAIVIEIFLSRVRPLLPSPVQIASSAFLIVFFWTSIAVFGGMLWPAVIGGVILLGLAIIWSRSYYRFDEMLVLVNEDRSPIETRLKALVHDDSTPLHSAFSVFLFNERGELLLQQRAWSKKTWPGVWSNSCCGHVMLHEKMLHAAARRLSFELGISKADLHVVLPDFRYRAEKDGVVENEICPVLIGFTDREPQPNPDEVAATKWIPWRDAFAMIRDPEEGFSPWAMLEIDLLEKDAEFQRLMSELASKR